MRLIHVDGGAFTEPPLYKFHDAYFSVVDGDTKELIHFEKNIGDRWSGEAEYEAIKWAVENIPDRPLKIYSDCTTAIAWAKHGSSSKSKFILRPVLIGPYKKDITVEYLHDNLADQWNAANHSPKKDKSYYYLRWKNRNEFGDQDDHLKSIIHGTS